MSKRQGKKILHSVRITATASGPKARTVGASKGGPSAKPKDPLGSMPDWLTLLLTIAGMVILYFVGGGYGLTMRIVDSLDIGSQTQVVQPNARSTDIPIGGPATEEVDNREQVAKPTAQAADVPTSIDIDSQEQVAEPTATATYVPLGAPTRLASQQPGVNVAIFSDPAAGERGRIRLEASTLAFSGDAYDIHASLYEAEVDSAGQWALGGIRNPGVWAGGSGSYNRRYEAGGYALKDLTVRMGSGEMGTGLDPIFAPKRPFHTTLVRVTFGALTVSVLNGQEVDTQSHVTIYRQREGEVGQPVASDDIVAMKRTDSRGLAEFLLAEGIYVVEAVGDSFKDTETLFVEADRPLQLTMQMMGGDDE